MKRVFLVLLQILFLFCGCSSNEAKKEQMLILHMDTIGQPGNYEVYWYTNQYGDTVVPVGRYSRCFTDTIRKIGFVQKSHEGFISIDNYGKEWYKIYDYEYCVAEGCFVITNEDRTKYGYATMEGEVIVEPKYSCCGGFSEGMAIVAIDSKLTPIDKNDVDSYKVHVGGRWGFVNKKGEEVVPLMYDSIGYPKDFVDGKVRVLKDGEWFYIDRNNKRLSE